MAGTPISASAGGGGPSGSSSNAGVMTPISTPFNFDNSGWVVNLKSDGATLTASGNKDANSTTQSGSGTSGFLSSLLSGQNMPLVLIAIGAFLVLRHKL